LKLEAVQVETVADPLDPRLGDYRDVRDREWLTRRGLFLAEGREAVGTLLEADDFEVVSVLVSAASLESLRPRLERLGPSVPVYRVDRATLLGTSGVRFHQGCVAAGRRRRVPAPEELLDGARLILVLEDVTDPDNVGGLFRNAHAFGVDAVLVSPRCASPLYRKSIRTSLGASLRLAFAELDPWLEGLARLGRAGLTCIALTPDPSARDLGELGAKLALPERIALLVGNEGEGLSPGAHAACDLELRIPMRMGADSLNVATSAAIALHRLLELRRAGS
jgi:tRNA G18 (ribose-2'-O)-methylase SpoU